ncbi:MAG: hypothetical protein GWP58_14500, partial [Gammaproteobacteria bacterium]|nr:hypothetical protein [Gammaproteobacteria bacterium]
MLRLFITIMGAALFLQACTAIPVEQRPYKRAELNRVAEETISLMVEQDPALKQALENSEGYFISQVSSANVALIGGGQGIGVLVDNTNGDRSYLNVKRFDLGAGLGVRYFRVLVLIETREAFEEIRRGKTFKAVGAEITAGAAGTASTARIGTGTTVHLIEESGTSIAATARLVSLRVNRDLTDTGLSEIGIPNIGFDIDDGREETERRWWDHKMPFMAQKVIDMG